MDRVFCEKLYGDMQTNGVRCWYLPEDFSAGANSYAVRSDGGGLQWRANVDGQEVAWSHEPETTTQQRLKVDMLSILPLDSLL